MVLQPFRFLNLPKEIRLMIYEEIAVITWNRCIIPLATEGHNVTLINPSIAVRILATSRFVNDEASTIIRPRLECLLVEPPQLFVKLEYLTGLCQTRYKLRLFWTVIDDILQGVDNADILKAIHSYRRGKRSLGHKNQAKWGDAAVKGLATFILRATRYKESNPDYPQHPLCRPSIKIVIEVPTSISLSNVDITFARGYRLLVGIICRHRLPSIQTYAGNLSNVMSHFAFNTLAQCKSWGTMAISLVIRYRDANEVVVPPPVQLLMQFEAAVSASSIRLALATEDVVCYGGVYNEDGEVAKALEGS
jgi:hypothetical protein